MSNLNTAVSRPQIYVGTYAKYNSGSIAGTWLSLEDYDSHQEFYNACSELHSNEHDPEFMFQDWQDIPEGMIGESWLSEDVWNWLEMDEDEREMVEAYHLGVDSEGTLEQAKEVYYGTADSVREFTENFFDELYPETAGAESIGLVIDWEATWNCNLRHSFIDVRHNGTLYIFNRG